MRNKIITGVVAVLALAGAWYWFSPGYAMQQLREAAVAGDKQELAERVDFPAVRESLKNQFKVAMMAKLKEDQDNPFAGLAAMMVGPMIDGLLETAISPEGVKGLVEHGKFQKQGETATGPEAKWNIERDGLNRFRVTPEVEQGENAPTIVFIRDGLGWKMVDIELPAEGLSDKPEAAAPGA